MMRIRSMYNSYLCDKNSDTVYGNAYVAYKNSVAPYMRRTKFRMVKYVRSGYTTYTQRTV